MQTVLIELTRDTSLEALQALENKQLIRILKESDFDSYCMPGQPVSQEDFKNWIEYTEKSPTISFTEAKQRWAGQKRKLQNLIG